MTTGALVSVPELQVEGLARQLGERSGFITIRFLASGAEMTQDARQVLRRVLLPGTRVRIRLPAGESDATVATAQVTKDTASGLLVYRVAIAGANGGGAGEGDRRESNVREDAIVALPAARDAEEQLLTVAFDDLKPISGANASGGRATGAEPWGPMAFAAREELLAWRDAAWARTGGVVGLAGARVVPLPHQLLAARTALTDRQIRFLLADEVGLGKTIEAGLIVQSLLAIKPDLRVLVVVPGALVSQWFLELHIRFGGRAFTMLDAERLRGWTGNPWADQPFVIASARAVEDLDARGAMQLATSTWDVLVVDECHRMQPGGLLYKRVAVLSKRTSHVLLLSATPARSHPDAYLALLHLLTPQVWRIDDHAGFSAKLAAHGAVVDLLARTLRIAGGAAEKDDTAAGLAAAWKDLLGADTVLAGLADAWSRDPGDEARDRLVAYVREQHQLDRRIIRRRRETLARLSAAGDARGLGLGTRSRVFVRYDADAGERAARSALAAYAGTLLRAHAPDAGKGIPPRLAHWLLTLELACASHPAVLGRLLSMRAAVIADPEEFAAYRDRATAGESTAHVLRHDLSEAETSTQIAISAASHADPAVESAALAAVQAAATAWERAAAARGSARLRALIGAITAFWIDSPQEKLLVFTAHGLAVEPIVEALGNALGEEVVGSFGSHQDTVQREEAVRRFREDDRCAILVSDPLGGEGRNFQFVSVVVHHDLPWSVAAVEQRIGRVDRIGRDGEVPSWVIIPEEGLGSGVRGLESEATAAAPTTDAAWAEVLDRAVEVFSRPSSGLEFALDSVETIALDAALALPPRDAPPLGARAPRPPGAMKGKSKRAGSPTDDAASASPPPESGQAGDPDPSGTTPVPAGGPGVASALPRLRALIGAERSAIDRREDEGFQDDATAFASAAAMGAQVAQHTAPVEAVMRWTRGMGGSAKREDDHPNAIRLRTRIHDQTERGVFDRDRALTHPDLSFYALGHGLIDRLVADAVAADWCRASAWRRKPGKDGRKWDGVRAALDFVLDLAPLAAAGLRVEILRRLFVIAAPKRLVVWARTADGALETDPGVVSHLATPFDPRRGDSAISAAGSRDAWTRPFITGQGAKVVEWQGGIRRALAGVRAHAGEIAERERDLILKALRAELDPTLAAAEAGAKAVAAQVGDDHADAIRARLEAEEERKQHDALIAAVGGARLEVVTVGYVVVG